MECYRPRDYQEEITRFVLENKCFGVFVKMGLGKTVSTLLAVHKLLYEQFTVRKVLVIAPKRVAENVWIDEAAKWDCFQRPHLKVVSVSGTDKQRRKVLESDADVYCLSRDNVVWLVENKLFDFDMLVVDESSSFKNHSSKRFKALKKMVPLLDRVVLLSGTPAPRGYANLWPQFYLLDRGQRLGRTITMYREAYFYYIDRSFEYALAAGSKDRIDAKVKDICVGMDNKDFLKMEEPVINDVVLYMDDRLRADYRRFKNDLIVRYTDGRGSIVAGTSGVLSGKLMQFASGAIYDENKNARLIHEIKIEALSGIVEDSQGENILIFYNYQHEKDRIGKKFKYRELKTTEDIRDWNAGKIPILLCHPASVGHGLNIQMGGHIIVWFSLTWDLELYEQSNARLARPGQKSTVVIHRLLLDKTRDMECIKSLDQKGFTQDAFMDSIKYNLLNN